VHIVFSFSAFLSYTLLVVDLGLIGYLSMRAYQDADTLDRYDMRPGRGSVEADEGWIDARCLSLDLWLARFWTMSKAYDGVYIEILMGRLYDT